MKTKKISKFEEKYIFNISLTFWRIVIAIGVLGAILGVLLLLWGIVPPFKHSPNREKYPPIVSFSVNELKEEVLPKQVSEITKPQEELKQITKTETEIEKLSPKTNEETNYRVSLDSIRVLIPKEYDSKLSKGHWYYPRGKRYWDRYKRSEYRKWIVDFNGLYGLFVSVYKRINVESYTDKKILIDAYISTVKLFPENKRVDVIGALTSYSTVNLSQSITNIQLLAQSIQNFALEDTKYLTALANFGQDNPRDGNSFIKFINKIISDFDAEYRYNILEEVLIKSYYRYFNVNEGVNKQIEITNEFLSMIPEFEPKYQAKALIQFYSMYFEKNADRERSIKQIDRKYENDLADAESKLLIEKQKKSQVRIKGLYLVGAGLVLIAFLALILVFLSIQKSIRKIEFKLTKN